MVLILTRRDVEKVLTMREAIDAVEDGFRELAEGGVQMPPRQLMTEPERHGWVGVMPAYAKKMKALATKIVTVYPENPSKHMLPTTMATIVLNDPETGRPLAVMDGGYITAVRTGAVGGVAAKYLARVDVETAGVFGAGVQARAQLEALLQVRSIKEVYVYDVVHEAAVRYADEMSERLGVEVRAVERPEEAVKGCGVIVTASTSKTPVFKGEWLEPGTHINGIGAHTADRRELDTYAVKRAKVIVDLKAAAEKEYGDILIPVAEGAITFDHIYCELGDIVSGRVRGRVDEVEITFFKSGGLAIQDAAAALLTYKRARNEGVGLDVGLI